MLPLGAVRLALGTAGLAFRSISFEEAVGVILAAHEAGIRIIDTALAYTREGSESFAEAVVAEALRELGGGELFIATKGGHWRNGSDFPIDGRAATLRRHCDVSLRMLEVDCIDLYQLHHVDPDTPIEESVQALDSLRREGKVARIGLSNVGRQQLARARSVARIDTVQNELSLTHPDDLDFARYCISEQIDYLAYQPMGGADGPPAEAYALAARLPATPHEAMIAWLRKSSSELIPIVGATRRESIRSAVAAMDLTL